MRAGIGLTLGLAAAVALAGQASAATIEKSGGDLVVRGATGETNYISVSGAGAGQVRINDIDQPITAWPGECAQEDGTYAVLCTVPARLVVQLGDLPDRFQAGGLPTTMAVEAYGGAADDSLSAGNDPNLESGASRLLDGGDGIDQLVGSNFADTLRGGAGDDVVSGWGGADVVDGGDGADELTGDGAEDLPKTSSPGADVVDGGPGVDLFDDYRGTSVVAVGVTFDGQANDGRPGEGDNLLGIETVRTFVPGTFDLDDGPQTVYVHYNEQGATTVRGHGGDDWLEGEASGTEHFDGGSGNDHLEGGWGNDTIVGGPGEDAILGDSDEPFCGTFGGNCTVPMGNDVIEARDGESDVIDCGPGEDRAVVDAQDVVANCETVERSDGPGPGPDPNLPGAMCTVPKVKGLKKRAAVKKVRTAGCVPKVKKVAHRKVRRGRAIKTSPKAGNALAAGAAVTLRVSKGKS